MSRITQHIIDNLNDNTGPQRRAKRTVMALIDFSRAFDRVWHTGLLWKLKNLGSPKCLLRCIKAFLANQISRVKFEGKTSKYRKVTGGVLQGSVLSPTLFLIFINDNTDQLPEGIVVSLFADDLAILASHEDLNEAARILQEGLDAVEAWAKKWKMQLNVEKCEITHFTTWTKEASWRPSVTLHGHTLQYAEAPTFLGVTFDWKLSFTKHVDKLKKKLAPRINTLRCLTGKSWGSQKEDLRLVYVTYIKSALQYASNAWYPCLSKSNKKALDTIQNSAARIITGCTADTNTVLLLNEAKLLPLDIEASITQTAAYERGLRLPTTNPLRQTAEKPTKKRLSSLSSWRETGQSVSRDCGLEEYPREELTPTASVAPWRIPPNLSYSADLIVPTTKEDSAENQRSAAEETIRALPDADIEIFTDGSARDGTTLCGSGILIKEKSGAIHRICKPAGRHGSSYRAESVALHAALDWTAEHRKTGNIHIFTDSRALVLKLQSGTSRVRTALENEIWCLLKTIVHQPETTLHIQWIPGHCGIEGNEEADYLGNQGQLEDQREVPIDLATAKTVSKRHIL